MIFRGIQKTSLIDYPGEICTILFLPGCNFRCGFCHNPGLILDSSELPEYSEDWILDFLESRKRNIQTVCITGGEPTLQSGLIGFLSELKKRKFRVKLDTNGSNPEILKEIIDKGLIDFVAMDIKGPWEDYSKICGTNINVEKIKKSADLIQRSGVDYEFRTTVVPIFIGSREIEEIGKNLAGAKKYCLQQFRNQVVLDEKFREIQPYPPEEIKNLGKIAERYFQKVEIRV